MEVSRVIGWVNNVTDVLDWLVTKGILALACGAAIGLGLLSVAALAFILRTELQSFQGPGDGALAESPEAALESSVDELKEEMRERCDEAATAAARLEAKVLGYIEHRHDDDVGTACQDSPDVGPAQDRLGSARQAVSTQERDLARSEVDLLGVLDQLTEAESELAVAEDDAAKLKLPCPESDTGRWALGVISKKAKAACEAVRRARKVRGSLSSLHEVGSKNAATSAAARDAGRAELARLESQLHELLQTSSIRCMAARDNWLSESSLGRIRAEAMFTPAIATLHESRDKARIQCEAARTRHHAAAELAEFVARRRAAQVQAAASATAHYWTLLISLLTAGGFFTFFRFAARLAAAGALLPRFRFGFHPQSEAASRKEVERLHEQPPTGDAPAFEPDPTSGNGTLALRAGNSLDDAFYVRSELLSVQNHDWYVPRKLVSPLSRLFYGTYLMAAVPPKTTGPRAILLNLPGGHRAHGRLEAVWLAPGTTLAVHHRHVAGWSARAAVSSFGAWWRPRAWTLGTASFLRFETEAPAALVLLHVPPGADEWENCTDRPAIATTPANLVAWFDGTTFEPTLASSHSGVGYGRLLPTHRLMHLMRSGTRVEVSGWRFLVVKKGTQRRGGIRGLLGLFADALLGRYI